MHRVPTTSFNDHNIGHREVRGILARCKIPQYLEVLIAEGFDCLKSLCEISEDDLIALKVKRGHRRLLQREIATCKGIPRNQPLWIRTAGSISAAHTPPTLMAASQTPAPHPLTHAPGSSSSTTLSTTNHPSDSSGSNSLNASSRTTVSSGIDFHDNKKLARHEVAAAPSDTPSSLGSISIRAAAQNKGSDSSIDGMTSSSLPPPPKRRYRRHPKPDRNAPVKPPSAYVMFANDVRAQLKDHNLTFSQLAKVTGERWKTLDEVNRGRYETMASEARKIYSIAQEQYRMTPEYKRYQDYLNEFRLTYEPHRCQQRHQRSPDSQSPKKFMRSLDSPGSGSMADCSSNGNSAGQVSSSSSGSADGGDGGSSRKRKKPSNNSGIPKDGDEEDDAVVRGFFQVQGDDENIEDDDDVWPDYTRDSVPTSFSGQCLPSLATSDCSRACDAKSVDNDSDDKTMLLLNDCDYHHHLQQRQHVSTDAAAVPNEADPSCH